VQLRGMYTQLRVRGSGLAGQTFAAHLHASSCSVNSGGPHYQSPGNPHVADSVSENWPTLACDSSGNCTGGASSAWVASAGALASGLSIVIHDTPNATNGSGLKMLCADLSPPRQYTGSFAQLASYGGAGYSGSSGVAELQVSATGIMSRIQFSGPAASAGTLLTFAAHLHAAPCSQDGGVHYQDPSNPGVVDAMGENWPTVQCDSNGMCGGVAWNNWYPSAAALDGGLSIVIHDTPAATTGSGAKWMCADLALPVIYGGQFTALSGASTVSGPTLPWPGQVELRVSDIGISSFIRMNACPNCENLRFAAHLHASSCSVVAGGPHYQNPGNPGVADAVSEHWPTVYCSTLRPPVCV